MTTYTKTGGLQLTSAEVSHAVNYGCDKPRLAAIASALGKGIVQQGLEINTFVTLSGTRLPSSRVPAAELGMQIARTYSDATGRKVPTAHLTWSDIQGEPMLFGRGFRKNLGRVGLVVPVLGNIPGRESVLPATASYLRSQDGPIAVVAACLVSPGHVLPKHLVLPDSYNSGATILPLRRPEDALPGIDAQPIVPQAS